MLTSEEKLQRGFRAEDDILVPLPVDSSSDEDEAAADGRHADEDLPSSASVLVEAFLEDVVQRSAAACVGASESLFDLDFWQNEAAQLGLHVMRPDRGSAGALPPSAPLRRSLDRRGYLQSPTLFPGDADEATLSALRRMLARLKRLGFAPGFLYVFDEAWLVIERCMRLLGDVLVPEAGTGRGVQHLVLEPSVFAHALEKPASAEDTDEEQRREAASQDASEIARHSYLGGNFGLPHRDHSSSDCFDAASGEPVLLSLWCPLTRVTADNGCMFVLPKDRDPLLHQPRHPHHLRPFDASSGTLRFGLGGAVALAPCDAGCALAWHGSLVHWGGCCSAHAEEGPRASLTAGLRLRSSRATQLQAEQSEGELTVEQLPPPLEARLRMVASSLLVYRWWFPLRGAVPARFVPAAASRLATLEEGVLRVAVEAAHVPDPLDPRCWMLRYTEALGSRLGLRVQWVEVPFDGSWALAGEEGAVDLVATNVAPSPQRRAEAVGAAFSDPFMYERRALRVREADAGRYATICDFGGERVGAVRGMNAEIDLRRRVQTHAPAVSVVATDTFPELYELFHRGELAAVAQAEYYAIDGSVIPSSPPGIVLVDHHDLVPGQREECAFVVRGASRGLLEAVNEFIATTAFPVAGELGKRDG